MKIFRKFCWAVAVVLLSVAQGAYAQAVGDKAKLNNVTTFDGRAFDPKSIEGKPTLLYFWASWCPICRREMLVLEQHYQTYKDKDFNIVAINFRDEEPKARAMVNMVKPSFVVGLIDDQWRNDYPNLKSTPTWYLLDKNGVIRKIIVGKEVISGGWLDGLTPELKKVLSN